MEIQVELFGQLSSGRGKVTILHFDMPVMVSDVLARLEINMDDVGFVVINGVQSLTTDMLLTDGRLSLFPYITGG